MAINNNTVNSQITVESNRGTGASNAVVVNFRNINSTSNKTQFTIGGGTVVSGESRTFSFGTDVNGTGVKDFYIYNGATSNATLVITPTDNIRVGYTGISYTDAGYKLDVNGTVRVQGSLFVTVVRDATQIFTAGARFQVNDTNNYLYSTYNINVFGGTNSDNDPSAVVTMKSTTKGFLPPRMTTTQKNAISTPAAGLIVFDTTLAKHAAYSGTAWETFGTTYIRRSDFVTDTNYIGVAVSGSSESASVWKIYKIVVSSSGATTKTSATNVAWTDRYTVIYS